MRVRVCVLARRLARIKKCFVRQFIVLTLDTVASASSPRLRLGAVARPGNCTSSVHLRECAPDFWFNQPNESASSERATGKTVGKMWAGFIDVIDVMWVHKHVAIGDTFGTTPPAASGDNADVMRQRRSVLDWQLIGAIVFA